MATRVRAHLKNNGALKTRVTLCDCVSPVRRWDTSGWNFARYLDNKIVDQLAVRAENPPSSQISTSFYPYQRLPLGLKPALFNSTYTPGFTHTPPISFGFSCFFGGESTSGFHEYPGISRIRSMIERRSVERVSNSLRGACLLEDESRAIVHQRIGTARREDRRAALKSTAHTHSIIFPVLRVGVPRFFN